MLAHAYVTDAAMKCDVNITASVSRLFGKSARTLSTGLASNKLCHWRDVAMVNQQTNLHCAVIQRDERLKLHGQQRKFKVAYVYCVRDDVTRANVTECKSGVAYTATHKISKKYSSWIRIWTGRVLAPVFGSVASLDWVLLVSNIP